MQIDGKEHLRPEDVARRRARGGRLLEEGNRGKLPECPFAVLSTFNLDLFPTFLTEALERAGLYSRITLGGFNQMSQEVLDAGSGLYRARPEGVVVVPAVEDLLAPLYARPSAVSEPQEEELIQQRITDLTQMIETLLDRLPAATCYLVHFGPAQAPAEHVLDPRSRARGQSAALRLLDRLRDLGGISPRVVPVDWDWHMRRRGADAFADPRLWYLGRMRLNPLGLATLADLVARHVSAVRGSARKVAVVDLDNTLWGGVIGELGLQGIALGEEGLGLAYQDFQRELLKLHDVGIVLAVSSKNNPGEVAEVFDRHPSIILKREHFSAERINWEDKATHLKELAAELRLGLDSFVLLDDSPVERDWVRQALPDVLVPDLPADPAERPAFLRRSPFFSRIAATDEDRHRTESYRAEKKRRGTRGQAVTFEAFLESLQQKVTIAPVETGSVARAAQLCQRTNQFNLVTRRYTAAEIETMMEDGATRLFTLSVRDRYGDSGITGLGILRIRGNAAEIDLFLLSCRVLGRRIEDTFLSFLAAEARDEGARQLTGRYVPTPKNGQTATFYPDRGFERVEEGVFRLDLTRSVPPAPPQIHVEHTGRA